MAAGVIGLLPVVFFTHLAEGLPTMLASGVLLTWIGLVWSLGALFVRRRAIRMVETHSVLTIHGSQSIEITSESITVSSADKSATWPLKSVLIRGSKPEFLVLELQSCLILVIPWDAEVDPQPFEEFRRAVRRRLFWFLFSRFCLLR
jgi:hypothetical protein